MVQFFSKHKYTTGLIVASGLMVLSIEQAMAAGGPTIGTMASSITSTFAQIGQMITGGSYIAGLAFSLSAIMKFKQHKDNPTQIPIGTPIALVFVGASLLFLPSILNVAGYTMFGTKGKTAGPAGITIE
ncbi:MAG: type IV secretion protein IcmD [Legionella sp.]|nr:MAG: type IV secretion protein IcmD [Legionella sp.]PJE00098.1 MAG: type IV secretion protein IcmD [Legionella sp.]